MRYHDVTPRSELHERIKQLEAGNKAQAERIKKLEELAQECCDAWFADSGWDRFHQIVLKFEQALKGNSNGQR